MLSILRQLIHINMSPDQIIFTGKWLLVVPLMFFHGWVCWRAFKSFSIKK